MSTPDGLLVSLQAAGVGILAGFAAYALYALIGFVSNLVFLQRLSIQIPALQQHHLGMWVLIAYAPVLWRPRLGEKS